MLCFKFYRKMEKYYFVIDTNHFFIKSTLKVLRNMLYIFLILFVSNNMLGLILKSYEIALSYMNYIILFEITEQID